MRSAITDTGVAKETTEMSPGVCNLFGILLLCESYEAHNYLMEQYDGGNLKYNELKQEVTSALCILTKNYIEKRKIAINQKKKIIEIVVENSLKNREVAAQTIAEVKSLIGLL